MTDCVKKWMKRRENRDGKRVWECARAVAGTLLELKRRVFQPHDEVPITAQEWDEYMTDTFHARLASPLGPQPSKGCVLGQLPRCMSSSTQLSTARTTKQLRRAMFPMRCESSLSEIKAQHKSYTSCSNNHSDKVSTQLHSAHHRLHPLTKATT